VKSAKRQVRRTRHGLIELSLVAAASNAGTSVITLRRKFGIHGIQPNGNGKYLIADLLKAFGPNGDSAGQRSLESRADLQRDNAELTRLEIAERRKDLVKRAPVLDFLRGLGLRLHSAVEDSDLDPADKRRWHGALEECYTEFLESSGWPLLSEGEIEGGRVEWPYLRTPSELWRRVRANHYEAGSEQRRGTRRAAAEEAVASDRVD
jgi:hypothetical protein